MSPPSKLKRPRSRIIEAYGHAEQQQRQQRQAHDHAEPGCSYRERLPGLELAASRPAREHSSPRDAAHERDHDDPPHFAVQHEARQVHAARIDVCRPERERLLRHRHGPQHADVPDEELQQQGYVAHGLHVGRGQPGDDPIRRQPAEADSEAEQRRHYDAEPGDEQRVQKPDQERAPIAHGAAVFDQRLRDVEARGLAEEAEARGEVLLAQVLRGVGDDLVAQHNERDDQRHLEDEPARLGVVEPVEAPHRLHRFR